MFSQTLLLLATILNSGASDASAPDVQAPQSITDESPAATPAPRRARVAARLSASDVVGKVQSFYLQTKQLTAMFRQTYTNSTFGKESVSDGKVWIKKPGKMRWDYSKKNRRGKARVDKSFISDGTMLWGIEHDNKQITQTKIEADILPVAVTFLFGKGDLSRDFAPALDSSGKYGKKGDYVLELTPRTPSAQYKMLYLVVDPGNFRVKQSIVIEASGNVNHFLFFSPDTKKRVKDAWFSLNVKKYKKYRIIEPGKKK